MWTSLHLRLPTVPTVLYALHSRPTTLPTLGSLFLPRPTLPALPLGLSHQTRHGSNLSPRRTKHRKAHKGSIPVRTGGSTKGTTVVFGEYGLRITDGARLSAVQLTAAHTTIKRKIKTVKGSKLWMRVFPDIPVSSKGSEVRMGKGKGAFEYWACRVPINRIVFEVGGLRKEIAKEALRLGGHKLPVKTEFVEKGTPPVVGAGYVREQVGDARKVEGARMVDAVIKEGGGVAAPEGLLANRT
ncbi:ribosomal protein L10e/L16 [Jimgerdemannia flammicorona]|uniref:Ribosomal protein L10e/L16 n=2 Tax=Jimgerdemannia flammicorona TaxID=994334 RepID=A0A433BAA1_9FUNG|nr:ribosomal protein L10e/L16 [Jimgerdemannia flammicorona]RUS27794.1 ribosomal protein L10e/L16 [Jimgerdemannia flammicorona]